MKIEQIVLAGPFGTNCYLVSTDKAALVIDPGEYLEELYDFLDDSSEKERLILITHGHCDHIDGAARLRAETGVEIAIGEYDAPATMDTSLNLSDYFYQRCEPFDVDRRLYDGEKFTVGDIEITAIHTPGHTVGGMCYLLNGCLFSGDTLFHRSIGRTDFPGGDQKTLMDSINKLFLKLDKNTVVYPGHMGETTLEEEKNNNPFLR